MAFYSMAVINGDDPITTYHTWEPILQVRTSNPWASNVSGVAFQSALGQVGWLPCQWSPAGGKRGDAFERPKMGLLGLKLEGTSDFRPGGLGGVYCTCLFWC